MSVGSRRRYGYDFADPSGLKRARAERASVSKRWDLAVFKRVLLVVTALNMLFFVLSLISALLPSTGVIATARQAFETGALTDDDYLHDPQRGYHQYQDCRIIQQLINDSSPLEDALAPHYLIPPESDAMCQALRKILFHGDMTNMEPQAHARYWHGPAHVVAPLLSVTSLENTRVVLKTLVYLSLLMLAFSATGAKIQLKIFVFSVSGVAAAFWALPYFGQSLGHAPGEAFLVLGLGMLVYHSHKMQHLKILLPTCAGFGAGIAYFEYFIGLLPIAAGLLFVLVYFINAKEDEQQLRQAWKLSVVALLAFCLGFASTVVLKQVLALLFTDAPVLESFTERFMLHISNVNNADHHVIGEDWFWGRLSGLQSLFSDSKTLTLWSETGATALWLATFSAWCGAFALTWARKRNRRRSISDLLALAAGSATVVAWTFIFPHHSAEHAVYMSRILMLPVALGATAFFIVLNSFISSAGYHTPNATG